MKAPGFWQRRGLLSITVSPLSRLYWRAVQRRTRSLVAQRMPVPVICVGNNTVGGAGKTPMVIACATLLQQAGKMPHVISRGYKGTFEGVVRVDPTRHSAVEVGDEPLLIARQFPCWVAKKRADAALAAIEAGADCILMDDGMQNPTLHKDLTIMVVDGSYGFGNRYMLPAGPCREPIAVSMAKADLLVVMNEAKNDDVASIRKWHDATWQAWLIPQDKPPEGKLVAFAGIARPEKFFDTLSEAGATLAARVAFADHHLFTEAELQHLQNEAASVQAQLITTEKDWLRLPREWRERVAFLPVAVRLEQQERFALALLNAFGEGT